MSDYGLDIKLTPLINIIGLPSSGKTTLLKMLINKIHNPNIYLDGVSITRLDLKFKKRNIAACFPDFKFNTAVVKEELLYYQGKCGFNIKTAFDRLDEFASFFDLEDIIDEKITNLNIYDQAYVKILALLIIQPEILGIDNLLTYLDLKKKQLIVKYAEVNHINILNVTANSEELLLGTDIVVLEKFRVKAYDKTEEILNNEKLLSAIGFNLPFVLSLSRGLKYYDLVDQDYTDLEALVGALWE